MPLLKLHTSVPAGSKAEKDELLRKLSKVVADVTGKPEGYVMVVLEGAEMSMAGKPGPAAYADVRAIGGLTPGVNRALSEKLGNLLEAALHIPPDRVFVTFTDVAATNWGWDRKTLG